MAYKEKKQHTKRHTGKKYYAKNKEKLIAYSKEAYKNKTKNDINKKLLKQKAKQAKENLKPRSRLSFEREWMLDAEPLFELFLNSEFAHRWEYETNLY